MQGLVLDGEAAALAPAGWVAVLLHAALGLSDLVRLSVDLGEVQPRWRPEVVVLLLEDFLALAPSVHVLKELELLAGLAGVEVALNELLPLVLIELLQLQLWDLVQGGDERLHADNDINI